MCAVCCLDRNAYKFVTCVTAADLLIVIWNAVNSLLHMLLIFCCYGLLLFISAASLLLFFAVVCVQFVVNTMLLIGMPTNLLYILLLLICL